MTRTREQMAQYQRDRRQRQREKVKTPGSGPLGTDQLKPAKTSKVSRRGAAELPTATAYGGHIHEWRRADDECICDECGEIVPWRGQLLDRYTDGLPEWPALVQGLPSKEITRLLSRINSKQRG